MKLGLHFARTIFRSVFLVTFLFFSLVALIELVEIGNSATAEFLADPLRVLGRAALTSANWAIDLLPISFLVGAILAIIELQNNRELIVAKASGISIWGIVLWPSVTFAVFGLLVTYLIEPGVLAGSKALSTPATTIESTRFISSAKPRWFTQEVENGQIYVQAKSVSEDGLHLRGVSTYQHDLDSGESRQLSAQSAQFVGNAWIFSNGQRISSDGKRAEFDVFEVATQSTTESVRLQLGSVFQMPIFELQEFLNEGESSTSNAAAALMRLKQMEMRPALLVGALLIAFAFTTGYRRHGTSGTQVLYGIVLGFVLYVITKLLYRAGETGSMDASLAAWGPAIVTIVIGTSVLLWKEDG